MTLAPLIPRRPVSLAAAAAVYLLLQLITERLLPNHAALAAFPWTFCAPLLAIAGVWYCSRPLAKGRRGRKLLVIAALAMWAGAYAWGTWEEQIAGANLAVNIGSQILFFFYGAPMLMAIVAPPAGAPRQRLLTIDAVQLTLLVLLMSLAVFDVVPFSHREPHPAPAAVLVRVFDFEALLLAVLAMLRMLATPPQDRSRRFALALCVALAGRLLSVVLNNHFGMPDGVSDALDAIPFLLLAVLLFAAPETLAFAERIGWLPGMAKLLDNSSPMLLPVSVVALSMAEVRAHPVLAPWLAGIGMLLSGVRSTLLLLAYQQAQAEASAARDAMQQLSVTDPLTGVPNRRAFDEALRREWTRGLRSGEPVSVVLLDIDHFKQINDRYGHADGDICLRQVAYALLSSLQREFDSLARVGGEEFAAVLPGTDEPGAERVADRMHQVVRGLRLRNEGSPEGMVTVSAGICTAIPQHGFSLEEMLARADHMLYEAKRRGRNRSESCQLGSHPPPLAAGAAAERIAELAVR